MRKVAPNATAVATQNVNMPIYTKTGDKGTTSLADKTRISKSDLRIEAYASADELTTMIGFANINIQNKKDKNLLLSIQKDLYVIMSFLAGAKVPITSLPDKVKSFEQYIDEVTSKLAKLNRFILPGGTEIGARLHLCRVACRKAERRVISYYNSPKIKQKRATFIYILPYFNRLSDLFFTLARKYSRGKEIVT